MRNVLLLIVVVILAFPDESHSGVRFADVGFEIGGSVGVLSPTQFNQVTGISDADATTWVYGFGAAAVLSLGELFRASIGAGYSRSQSHEGLYIAPNATMAPAPAHYKLESVPIAGGVEFLLTESITPAVILGAAFEMHFLTVTRSVNTQPGYNGSASTTIPGLSMNVGIEWPVNERTFLGFRGGYRFVEGEALYIDRFAPGEDSASLNLGGAFATILIRVHPWQRINKD